MVKNMYVEEARVEYDNHNSNFGIPVTSTMYIKIVVQGNFEFKTMDDVLKGISEHHLSQKYDITFEELKQAFPEKFI